MKGTEVDGKEEGERVEDILLQVEADLKEHLHNSDLRGFCEDGRGESRE